MALENPQKTATPDHPIHELHAKRYSPYCFADRDVSDDDLRSLFEAARWSASSYNEQPWRFFVARRNDGAAYEKLLSCLVEANQAWAKAAPVLALGLVQKKFSRNDKPNGMAVHDLGLAAASLTFEATARGLAVHQMAGIDRDRIREVYAVPDDVEAVTGLAIGHAADPDDLEDPLKKRDSTPRNRKPLSEIVFGTAWGESSELVE